MSQYKCINGFTTFLGKRYNYGDIISSSSYGLLTRENQKNFRKQELPSSSGSGLYDSYIPPSTPIDYGSDSSSSWDSGSSSDSSSFDFGGGDTGGGGASGDW